MQHRFAHVLNPTQVKLLANNWLNEDQPSFDLSVLAFEARNVESIIWCKQDCILTGFPFIDAVIKECDCTIHYNYNEGSVIAGSSSKKTAIATVSGKSSDILRCERLILNILSRCSGIATRAFNTRECLNSVGWNGILAGSRKTTPGFRIAEKYSLFVGGASGHRFDLSHMVLLKDNHIKLSENIDTAVKNVRKWQDFASKIEVEVNSLEEGVAAAIAGADIIMLDNFTSTDAKEAAKSLKFKFPSILIDVSGGITPTAATEFASDDIDIISISGLIQGCPTIDFSMKIK